ncbi:hypothetical protein ARMGADRAFT_613136 [Armillaria gallica]|uniref:Uncharacterized protein n=1 Tax=Armillaria gallica TaxID=47427 RepID=A0A2H3D551_ARMGA|nr:hypothetical protein ARMGADRAFT_613136 [Armillaria gallica]
MTLDYCPCNCHSLKDDCGMPKRQVTYTFPGSKDMVFVLTITSYCHHLCFFPSTTQLIKHGTFASVYVILASLVAFKEVLSEADAPQLQVECDTWTLAQIYESCHSNSFFSLPRPLAYNAPRDSHSFCRLAQSPSRPVRTGLTRRLRPLRVVGLGSFTAFERPAFAMERIRALPTEISVRI